MKRLSLKALIIGGISDVVATNVLSFPVIIFVTMAAYGHVPQDQLGLTVAGALREGSTFALLIFIGCICSVLGGYIAARIAKHDEYVNGAASAWLCMLLGVFGIFLQHDPAQVLRQLSLEAVSPLLGFFGGYLRVLQIRRNATSRDAV